MSPWSAAVRALPTTFVIYLVEAAAALLAGLAPALQLSRFAPQGDDALARAAWLDLLVSSGSTVRGDALSALLTAALLVLLAPWLQMAWLQALAHGGAHGAPLVLGARLYWRACFVQLLALFAALLAALPWAGAAWVAARLLAEQSETRVHDLVVAGCLMPIIPSVLVVYAWSDLGKARALHEGAFTGLRRSLRDALRPSVLGSAAAFWVLGHALFAAALALSRSPWGGSLTLQVAFVQAGVLLRLILRSCWLGKALACAERRPASRAP